MAELMVAAEIASAIAAIIGTIVTVRRKRTKPNDADPGCDCTD